MHQKTMKNLFFHIILLLFFVLGMDVQAQNGDYHRVTNLPHIYIETENGAAITSKENYILCTFIYVDEDDQVTSYAMTQIRGRGNSTWGLAKKPYKIKFAEKQKLLGKGYARAKKWTLLANAGDKSLIRNAITSELGDWLGLKNSPAAKFVDLTLNGVYQGNYQLSDQVEVHGHRVVVAEQDYPLTEESDITGGYLLEVDGFKDGNWFSSSKGLPIRIHYPDDEEIVASQKNYISDYINSFEKALFSEDFKDPVKGYRPFVDSESLANFYVATEVSGNIDGFWSMYFYKNVEDSLLYFGPLWDYDIAYDNDNRYSQTERLLMADDGYGDGRKWFKQFWNDQEWFGKLINDRYQDALDDGMVDFMYEKIDSLTALLDESQELNYQKWGINRRMLREKVLYSSYEDYIDELKLYISEHTAYLKEAFANRKPIEPTPPFNPKNYYYHILNAGTSTAFDLVQTGEEYDLDNPPQTAVAVCAWGEEKEKMSQNWQFTPVGDYFLITNQLGLALCDPTEGECTPTTNLNTQLTAVSPDATDPSQLWTLTPQGTNGYYNLTNLHTEHTANLSGGGSSNGTKILSYSTDERNSVSNNRLWFLQRTSIPVPEDVTGIDNPDTHVETDYALVYNAQDRTLRFAGEDPSQLTFTAAVYTIAGQKIDAFGGQEVYSTANLPTGVYVVSWMVNGKLRSAKFRVN